MTSMYSAAAATDTLNSNRYECWARSQMKYVLGSDGVGHSFVVGFGVTPPVQCHHRAASCPDAPATCTFDNFNADTANPQVLYGAMVGGELLVQQHHIMQSDAFFIESFVTHVLLCSSTLYISCYYYMARCSAVLVAMQCSVLQF